MAKVGKTRQLRSSARRSNPCKLASCSVKVLKHVGKRKVSTSEKKDWEDATCSVCLEFPHNAVLLLCSSYDKGCRPYMCGTSHRFSNCLDQYKKAYAKASRATNLETLSESEGGLGHSLVCEEGKMEASELLCPLCRGQVKGWTVLEPARKYLNKKKRSCLERNCSFVGNYKKLRKHVKAEHPLSRPREVDPVLKEEWKRLEQERDRSDVISTLTSSTPGSFVVGDYLIETAPFLRDYNVEEIFQDAFLQFEAFGHRNIGFRLSRTTAGGYHSHEDDEMDMDIMPHGAPFSGEVRDFPARRLLFRQAVRRRRR